MATAVLTRDTAATLEAWTEPGVPGPTPPTPGPSGSIYSPLAAVPDLATIVPFRTIYLRDFGIVPDADVTTLGTADLGAADQTAKIQQILDLNKASGQRLHIVGDLSFGGGGGGYRINEGGVQLTINSNTTLERCGFIRADGANCKMLINANPRSMVAPGAGQEMATPLDHDIVLKDCFFNGNTYQGQGANAVQKNFVDLTSAQGWSFLVHMVGVDGLHFEGFNRFINQSTFSIIAFNCRNWTADKLYFYCHDNATYQTDGIKIWSCDTWEVNWIICRTFDDAVSVVSNDGLRNDNLNNSANGGHSRYDPHAGYGPNRRGRIKRLTLLGGYGLRLLSGDQLVSDFQIDLIEGATNQQVLIMGEQDQSGMFMKGGLPTGGQWKNIHFGRITATCLGKQYYPAVIWVAGASGMNCDSLTFEEVRRTNNSTPDLPTIQITPGCNITYLTLSQAKHIWETVANPNAILQIAGTVSNLNIHNPLNDRARNGQTATRGPIIRMQPGGFIAKLTYSNWDSAYATYDVEYEAGTISNIIGSISDYSGLAWMYLGAGKVVGQADTSMARPAPDVPIFAGPGSVLKWRGDYSLPAGAINYNAGSNSGNPLQYQPGPNFVSHKSSTITYGGMVTAPPSPNAIDGSYKSLAPDANTFLGIPTAPTGARGFRLIGQTSLTSGDRGEVNVYVAYASDPANALPKGNEIGPQTKPSQAVDNPNTSAFPWAWYQFTAPVGETVTAVYVSGQVKDFAFEGIDWIF